MRAVEMVLESPGEGDAALMRRFYRSADDRVIGNCEVVEVE
jgi:hypothetical protein